MATLQQIYVNLGIGGAVAFTSLSLFGLVIRRGYNELIAPRSWSRPKAILKNVLRAPFSFSWILWAYRQSYPDLLSGIPGTGTREDGWAGPTLKVNLDGIIMLKYHRLLLKVAALATLLSLVVVLPINVTAKCDPTIFGVQTCAETFNLTDFEATTIAHIPAKLFNGTRGIGETSADGDDTVHGVILTHDYQNVEEIEEIWVGNTSWRYFGIALVSLIIYRYICHLLWNEWIENLALRRTFFLEYDHYKERRDELDEVVQMQDIPEHPSQATRDPWLPHPELRETVPNISLYTCIYRLPSQIETDLPDTASDLERQLSASAKFFDQCIPPPPGFSSSVVAITILPEPAIVAQAWKKWKKHKEEMVFTKDEEAPAEVPVFDADRGKGTDDGDLDIANTRKAEAAIVDVAVEPLQGSECQDATEKKSSLLQNLVNSFLGGANEIRAKETLPKEESSVLGQENLLPNVSEDSDAVNASGRFTYDDFDIEAYAQSIGFVDELEVGEHFTNVGIEQLSVYAREAAQSASSACPYGCAAESKVRVASLEQLKALEKEAVENVRIANEELIQARRAVDLLCSGTEDIEDDVSTADSTTYDPATSKKDDGALPIESFSEKAKSELPGSKGLSNVRQRVARSTSSTWNQAQAIASSISKGQKMMAEKSSLFFGRTRQDEKDIGSTARTAMSLSAQIARQVSNTADIRKFKMLNLQHPAYAVVTLTSRQAAVTARQCLADGSGDDNWIEIQELPVAPLADAPPCDIMNFRGCCRPVTLTISDREKKIRKTVGLSTFLLFCLGYTFPLSQVSHLLNPEMLAEAFPDWEAIQDPDGLFYNALAGISSGILYTLFFSFCPQLFKVIANFEGNVSSKRTAEDKALQYYWYFMMITAFSGTALTQMLGEILIGETDVGTEIRDVLVSVADSIPTRQAPVWLNWLIIRFAFTLPFLYLFQANTFGFSIIQWQWCARMMRGGGPGGPPPYRIYVDSGTAYMCIVAMAPVCPLIAPLALIYFVVMLLMLRWLLVFVYRPWYDSGGNKWPALHEIIISSTIYGQILLATILALRNSLVPFLMVACAILPTYMFSQNCKQKFLRAYNDASLWQTSRLDRAEIGKADLLMSDAHREEYRKWLVDCHKASYVPICLAGQESLLTLEHATATPRDKVAATDIERGLKISLEKRQSQRVLGFNAAIDAERRKSYVGQR